MSAKTGVPFTKMHGAGNDFVVIDAFRKPVRVTPALAKAWCHRQFGAGADQLLIVEKSKKADLRMRILNADGSEVEMCGNGIRCVARFARDRGIVRKNEMTVETKAGIMKPVLLSNGVRVDMGAPILEAERIPTQGQGRVIDQPFEWKGGAARMTSVSMGNPHAVFFVKDLSKVPASEWGPAIETHPFFPRRVNVEFVQVESPGRAKVVVWERGSGLTMACGTGACAVGVAGILTGRFHRKVRVALPGGELTIEWAADDHVYMTGPAAYVYEGRFITKTS